MAAVDFTINGTEITDWDWSADVPSVTTPPAGSLWFKGGAGYGAGTYDSKLDIEDFTIAFFVRSMAASASRYLLSKYNGSGDNNWAVLQNYTGDHKFDYYNAGMGTQGQMDGLGEYFSDGFEDNTLNAWSNVAAEWTTSSSDPHDGSYRANFTDSSATPRSFDRSITVEDGAIITCWYQRVDADSTFEIFQDATSLLNTGSGTDGSWVQFTSSALSAGTYTLKFQGTSASSGVIRLDTIVIRHPAWVHLAYVNSGGTLTYYKDGVSQGTASANPTQSSGNLYLADFSGSTSYAGVFKIANLFVWNNAQTGGTIANLADGTVPSAGSANLILRYLFDEGSGTTAADSSNYSPPVAGGHKNLLLLGVG